MFVLGIRHILKIPCLLNIKYKRYRDPFLFVLEGSQIDYKESKLIYFLGQCFLCADV